MLNTLHTYANENTFHSQINENLACLLSLLTLFCNMYVSSQLPKICVNTK